MAQKAPILLHSEARNAFVDTINYFLRQGVPSYEIKEILDSLNIDISRIVDQELAQAQEDYNQAVIAECKQSETEDPSDDTKEKAE